MLPVPYPTFREEVLNRYGERAPMTRAKVRQILDEIGRLPFVETTADLTVKTVDGWKAAHPQRTRTTARSLLRAFRAICRYAMAMGYLDRDPFAFYSVAQQTQHLPPGRKIKKFHTQEELGRVMDLLRAESTGGWREARLFAMFATFAHTGLRRDEGLRLQVADLDLEAGVVRVVARKRLKTEASEASVPLSDQLIEILAGWILRTGSLWLFPARNGKSPWTGGTTPYKPLGKLKAAGLRAGVEGLTFLSLRHSFATHAGYWGLSPLDLQLILRHTSLQMQRHYVHADMANLRRAVRDVRFGARDDDPPTLTPMKGAS